MTKYFYLSFSFLILSCNNKELSLINQIPDYTQTDFNRGDSGNGQQYCAPVSISNSLVWLKNREVVQEDLIQKLASSSYMNTSLKNGTGTKGVLRGVDKLAKEIFGDYKSLKYQGWRLHQAEFSTNIKTPEISWIQQSISASSAVWLNIGWYIFDKNNEVYHRVGGHWVTLVGYDGNRFVIHDPSPRAGIEFSNDHFDVFRIKSGTLVAKKKGLPRNAEGYYGISNWDNKKKSADLGIIDGVIAFNL